MFMDTLFTKNILLKNIFYVENEIVIFPSKKKNEIVILISFSKKKTFLIEDS